MTYSSFIQKKNVEHTRNSFGKYFIHTVKVKILDPIDFHCMTKTKQFFFQNLYIFFVFHTRKKVMKHASELV